MDKLLFLLKNSSLGCHIENLFAGTIAYADDLIVLLASVRHLQLILDLCVDFCQECDIVFNCDKSQYGMVGKPIYKLAQMILDNKILKWSDNFIYLGIDFVLGSSLNGVCCKNRIRKFMASVSSVLHFKSMGYENFFAEILIRKCLPVLMYVLDAVSLDSNSIKLVTQVWSYAFM